MSTPETGKNNVEIYRIARIIHKCYNNEDCPPTPLTKAGVLLTYIRLRRLAALLLALCLLPALPAAATEMEDVPALCPPDEEDTGPEVPAFILSGPAEIPILMYHHIAECETYNTMTVSPQRFEADMVFLRDNGFTPLLPADLEAILQGEMPLPARPVMITFDDGYESNYLTAFPILKQAGMKATISLITQLVRTEDGKGSGWALSWKQCKEMYDSGLVDFGSHSWSLHNNENSLQLIPGGVNGIMRLPDESHEDYMARAGGDLQRSVETIESTLGSHVRLYTYPFGATDTWFFPLLEEQGISLAVTTTAKMADLSGNLLTLPRYRVDMTRPLGQMAAIKKIIEESGPLPFPADVERLKQEVLWEVILLLRERLVPIKNIGGR